MVSRLSRLTWYNTKILFDLNTIAAFLLVALAPFIFSFDLLSYKVIAKLSEQYFSIIGIILFVYIGNIENHEHTQELVNVRALPHWIILLIRKLIMLLLASIMFSAILIYARLNGSVFPYWELLLGIIITMLYLGSIGYTMTNFTNQISSGYIIAFAYYLFEYSTKGKYTGKMFLFSLMRQDFIPKYYLLAAALGIFAVNLIYTHRYKSKLDIVAE